MAEESADAQLENGGEMRLLNSAVERKVLCIRAYYTSEVVTVAGNIERIYRTGRKFMMLS